MVNLESQYKILLILGIKWQKIKLKSRLSR